MEKNWRNGNTHMGILTAFPELVFVYKRGGFKKKKKGKKRYRGANILGLSASLSGLPQWKVVDGGVQSF